MLIEDENGKRKNGQKADRKQKTKIKTFSSNEKNRAMEKSENKEKRKKRKNEKR